MNLIDNPEILKKTNTSEDLCRRFENKPPEIVFEWHDSETEAKGWVVINSLQGGAAGGGTRMRKGLDRKEVESLAKTMEVKFTVSGPPIGGAKSGIDFDPTDQRKEGVLQRWFKAVTPLLKNYYGTGGDLNVDEISEVIPFTEDYGLWHPQEGIVTGHFNPSDPQKIHKIGRLRQGVSKIIENPAYTPSARERYTVADMVTGYGVSESVIEYYSLWGGDIRGKRAIIQGWGNVGASAAFYLSKAGVRITGIIDKNGGMLAPEGICQEKLIELFITSKKGGLSGTDLIPFSEISESIWTTGAEIFIPAAASRLIDQNHITKMLSGGLEVIACGANVPFADPEIFMGSVGRFADDHVSVIPDFIANCGMARVFAYLMTSEEEITDEAVFGDISSTVSQSLEKIFLENPKRINIAQTAYDIALRQLI